MRSTWASAVTTTTGNSTPRAEVGEGPAGVARRGHDDPGGIGLDQPLQGGRDLEVLEGAGRAVRPPLRPPTVERHPQVIEAEERRRGPRCGRCCRRCRRSPAPATGSQSVKRHRPCRWSRTCRRGYSATSIPSAQQSRQVVAPRPGTGGRSSCRPARRAPPSPAVSTAVEGRARRCRSVTRSPTGQAGRRWWTSPAVISSTPSAVSTTRRPLSVSPWRGPPPRPPRPARPGRRRPSVVARWAHRSSRAERSGSTRIASRRRSRATSRSPRSIVLVGQVVEGHGDVGQLVGHRLGPVHVEPEADDHGVELVARPGRLGQDPAQLALPGRAWPRRGRWATSARPAPPAPRRRPRPRPRPPPWSAGGGARGRARVAAGPTPAARTPAAPPRSGPGDRARSVWWSASRTLPSGAPSAAAARRSSFVEPVSSTQWTANRVRREGPELTVGEAGSGVAAPHSGNPMGCSPRS